MLFSFLRENEGIVGWAKNANHKDSQPTSWKSFDSLSLKQKEDGVFEATIKYLNKKGVMEQQFFKDTQDEIEQQIKVQSDMPTVEQNPFAERDRASATRVRLFAYSISPRSVLRLAVVLRDF